MGNNLRAFRFVIGHIPIMPMTWKTRVESRLNELGWDMKRASREAGKGETFVRDMLKRDRSPSVDNFLALAAALRVTTNWLLFGSDDEFGAPIIPVVGMVGADLSGRIAYAEGDSPQELVPIPPGGSPLDKAVEVRGHSMRGFADDGSLIYYSAERPPSEDYLGEIVVCEVEGGERLVKKLQRGSRKGLYDLESINGETRRDAKLLWIAEITAVIPPRQARRLVRREAAE